ncbi:hypothetical protein [Primorskyibacter sedentarius]|uniref:hypothetical protein n=1 Tax=Primorskyibacter sedentarius TaxID=745311 RepID=UPI003EC12124
MGFVLDAGKKAAKGLGKVFGAAPIADALIPGAGGIVLGLGTHKVAKEAKSTLSGGGASAPTTTIAAPSTQTAAPAAPPTTEEAKKKAALSGDLGGTIKTSGLSFFEPKTSKKRLLGE